MDFARGYIASGNFQGHRLPQHIQNIIIRQYCIQHNLDYVLSRAEYSDNMNNYCQLWAALREGYKNIVAYSIWQMPIENEARNSVFQFALNNEIRLHFACEQLILDQPYSIIDFNTLLGVQKAIDQRSDTNDYLFFLERWTKYL